MKKDLTRRKALQLLSTAAVVGAASRTHLAGAANPPASTTDAWRRTHDRIWLGGEYWANPMEDWQMVDGGAECRSLGGNRSVHSLTHQITDPARGFTMSVRMTRLELRGQDPGAGFRLGVRSELNEYRSNCFVARGLHAGVGDGKLLLGTKSGSLTTPADAGEIELRLSGVADGSGVKLTLEARAPASGETLGQLSETVSADSLLGNVALVSNYSLDASPGGAKKAAKAVSRGGVRHRFTDWQLAGAAFTINRAQRFGPLLWAMYTLSDSRTSEGWVLKLSALTGPLGPKDRQQVELHVQRDGTWQSMGEAKLDPDAWVATFRLPRWNEKAATPYKLVYREQHRDGTVTPDEFTGTILANPAGRPLRMAAMTCQNDYAFPYEPVARNVARLKPDLVFFSGDQIYESHGGFGIIREPAGRAILNYLRKFYQFGWAFREVMRHCPTLCLPDDHDVFQGNIWGEGGARMTNLAADPGASSSGGYAEPARMVNVVHRTNVSHHPDPHDPAPGLQDISTYHGDLVYGGVGFAILADRQWKSSPEHVQTDGPRADHVVGRDFDTRTLDVPGLRLLGERQEAYLRQWVHDWRGHTLKAVLSQTVFAGLATHHGGYDGYLKGDLDSGAWPQTPRNRAIDILRPAMALHINGDQHLTTLAQYGVHRPRDSMWSFCTPAIAVGYPRWWRPDEVGMPHARRPKHGLPHTGEYRDGFGNPIYVYAVGNPEVGRAPNRYVKAHEKGSGFGFITFDPERKTYTLESYRFLIDPTDGKASNQFPGWPVTIHQSENRGENRLD
ncbi:MAG: alkaline phosphatase D family protein [Opitutaceae bacterium]